MPTTNFIDVCNLNHAFKKAQTSKVDTDWSLIEAQFKLIKEEFLELEKAIAERNWEELKDGVGDVLVTTYGLGYIGRFDCDRLMKNIQESNLSKLCTNVDLEATVRHWESLGLEVFSEVTEMPGETGVFYVVKSAKDQDAWEKHYPKGKALKNVSFILPSLEVEFGEATSDNL